MTSETKEFNNGKYKFVLSGKKVLIFVGDALCDASTEYPTIEEANQVWQQVLKAERVIQ